MAKIVIVKTAGQFPEFPDSDWLLDLCENHITLSAPGTMNVAFADRMIKIRL